MSLVRNSLEALMISVDVVGATVFGKVSDIIGRKVVMAAGTVIYAGGLVLVFLLKQHPHQHVFFYATAVALGLGMLLFFHALQCFFCR
jgi:MFS family permease